MFPDLWNKQLENTRAQDKVVFVAGDVRDNDLIAEVFKKFKPQIVFHAAACKHVPMMEINPKEAVKTNIFGTYSVVKVSAEYQIEKFILISTDKAVRPTSIMGTTKRMAEYICASFKGCGNTSFLSVRFGNVLGSRGSVLPNISGTNKTWWTRYSNSPGCTEIFHDNSGGRIPCVAVWCYRKRWRYLVLDMGEPVRVLTLAEELIKIHGLKPYKDINIEFVGLKPGEKLFEEVLTAEEGTTATKYEKIFIAKNGTHYSKDEIEKILKGFERLLKVMSIMEDYEIIRDTLNNYRESLERRSRERSMQKPETGGV